MKYICKLTSIIIVVSYCISVLSPSESFGKPVLNLITKDETTEEIEYVSIYPNGKSEKIKAFA